MELDNPDGHAILGGSNYGQVSSREHAALAPRYLGLRVVIAKDFARIHWQNLINFGVLLLTFMEFTAIEQGDLLNFTNLRQQLVGGNIIEGVNITKKQKFVTSHKLFSRQIDIVLAGGLINWIKQKKSNVDVKRRDQPEPA